MAAITSFGLATSHLRGGLGRLALSIVAIALGVGLAVAVTLGNSAVLASFIDTIDGMVGRTSLTISSGDDAPFDEALVDRVKEVPGVTIAIPLVTAVVFPDVNDPNDDGGELLTVQGLDLTDDTAIRVYHRADTTTVIDDKVAFLNRADSIVIGRELAARRHLDIGSPFDLVLPSGVRRFVVRGLLESEGLARTLAGRIVVMDLFAAEAAFTGPKLVNRIDVVVIPGAEAHVKADLQQRFPGLKIEEPSLRKSVFRSTVSAFQGMIIVFVALVCLAGFVICYSRLAAIFEARMWEVGLLRAVGLRRSVVFLEMLKESFLLGVVGTAIGIVLGVVIARWLLPFLATTTALQLGKPVPIATITVTRFAIGVGALVGIGAALTSAIVPALRLARRHPIGALTTRGRELTDETPGMGLIAPLVAFAAAVSFAVLQVRLGGTIFGVVATVTMAVAACFAARHVVAASTRLLTAVWTRWFGVVGELAAAHVAQHARRTGMTIATLALGTSLVLLFTILGWSFERTVLARLSDRIVASLIVTSSHTSGGWITAPMTDRLHDLVRGISGVAAVGGEARRKLSTDSDVFLEGFDLECLRDPRVLGWQLDSGALPDAIERVVAGTGAIITSAMARASGKEPGDSIELPSSSGAYTLAVVGITRVDPIKAIVINRPLFVHLTNDATITWLHVAVEAGVKPADVSSRISTTLGRDYRLRIQTRDELLDYFAGQVRQGFLTFHSIDIVVALLIVVGIGDLLATAVMERRRTFAMMRAVGIRRRSVFRSLVLEGATIGILGIGLGVILGGALGLFWVTVQFPALLGWALDVHVPLPIIVLALTAMWLLCVGAAVAPGIQAARLVVPSYLRND
jgi:putative ABC transport system permease protein